MREKPYSNTKRKGAIKGTNRIAANEKRKRPDKPISKNEIRATFPTTRRNTPKIKRVYT